MSDASISSRADLHDELVRLVQRAHENGVDVRGGWECPNGGDPPQWDVVVTAVGSE